MQITTYEELYKINQIFSSFLSPSSFLDLKMNGHAWKTNWADLKKIQKHKELDYLKYFFWSNSLETMTLL